MESHRPKDALSEELTIARALVIYYNDHAKEIVAEEAARIHSRIWLEYWEELTLADLSIEKQKQFHNWLLTDKGYSNSYSKRIINTGKAAINHAWKNRHIAAPVHILSINDSRKAAPPKGRPLSLEEMAALFDAIRAAHMLRFCSLMLGTAARPGAILDLHSNQLDFAYGLIHLNPDWREQNKKYRPTVKMPNQIKKYFNGVADGYVVSGTDAIIKSSKSAFRAQRRRAELGNDVNPYSFRHTITRWLRTQSVPVWEVQCQLGHSHPGAGITETYAPFDPAYLQRSTEAIEQYFSELGEICPAVQQLKTTESRLRF